jgi:hypothetical protein
MNGSVDASGEDPEQEALEALKSRLLAIKYLRDLYRGAWAEAENSSHEDADEVAEGWRAALARRGAEKRAIVKPRIGRAFEIFAGPADAWAKRAVFKPRIGRSFDNHAENSKRAIYKPRVGK